MTLSVQVGVSQATEVDDLHVEVPRPLPAPLLKPEGESSVEGIGYKRVQDRVKDPSPLRGLSREPVPSDSTSLSLLVTSCSD